jgi:nucleoside-diphosphate-sugar epimerase
LALSDVQIVVHAAAALATSGKSEIFSIDVDATRELLEVAFLGGISRFIFISTTAVYGVPDRLPSFEDDPLKGIGPYGEAKIHAENACLSWRKRGECVPILRPKSFIGPERLGVWELLYDCAFEGRRFPVIGGDNLYQLLDVDDLCESIYLCITQDRDAVNDTFNVGAAEFCTLRENFQTVLDRAGFGKSVISLPPHPVVPILNLLGRLHLSPVYEWICETALRGSYDSIEKIRSRLGFVPQHSNKQALVRNYDWYVAHRSEFFGESGNSHRVPWKKGILNLAKHML